MLTEVCTPPIERLSETGKLCNSKQRVTARHHTDNYFSEFIYRRLNRDDDLFDFVFDLMKFIGLLKPICDYKIL